MNLWAGAVWLSLQPTGTCTVAGFVRSSAEGRTRASQWLKRGSRGRITTIWSNSQQKNADGIWRPGEGPSRTAGGCGRIRRSKRRGIGDDSIGQFGRGCGFGLSGCWRRCSAFDPGCQKPRNPAVRKEFAGFCCLGIRQIMFEKILLNRDLLFCHQINQPSLHNLPHTPS